jgi:3-oxoacyl-[acyl-carrier-protein] synthase III
MMKKQYAAITAVGGYVPEYILTNEELETMVETNDEWITTRTGIKERRILKGEGLGTSVMATEAIRMVLEKSGTKPEEVDVLIVATITPDYLFPTTGNIICENLGLTNAFCFDMSVACSGFVHGLVTGAQFIESGNYKKVIVVGADKMSSIMDYTDRATCILFGDGAGAVLLEPNDEGLGVQDAILKQEPAGKDIIILPAGGSVNPATHETVDKRLHFFKQDGRAVFRYAVNGMSGTTIDVMQRNNLKGEDIAYLVPHQANLRILSKTAEYMGISEDKVTINIEKYGNTTDATIPLCLWEWEDKFKKGDNIILAAFGAGFNYGSLYLKWAY